MVKKILFIALLTTAFAFADDGWWIYTYEDVSTLKAVFNYLAMIKTDSGYMGIIQTVLIAGLTFTIIFKFLDIMAIPKYLLSVIGTMLIVFSTTTTVYIVNVKSYDSLNPHVKNYAVVDNVPFIFAVLSSAFSSVGYNSALLIETIFSNVAGANDTTQASFLKTGNLGAWKILDALDSISIFTTPDGKEFEKNLNDYLHLCIFKIAYAVDPGLKLEINTDTNPFTYLDPTSSPNEYIRNIGNQKVINSEGSLTTCNSTYNKAKNSLSILSGSGILYDKANKLISKITSNVDNAGSTVAKMMTGSGLASAQANINNYILMTGVRKAFENSWQSYGIGASSAQAGFGAGLAEANLQAQGKVKAKSASSMMPSIHSVLQAVMYVLFPLVLIVQLFAGGFKILQNYILGILWLELWIPSYSVLNYFTLKEAQEQAYDKLVSSTASSGPEGMLTLANQNEIYNTIANQAAIAADMYIVGIPALAGFILFASFQALSGITSGVAGVVGQYANNQTLNQERANLAALDSVNEQMKLNNPLYTGNVGTVQAMIAQEGSISQASKAAANFLASGSNLENFNNLTKGNMFKGLEQTTSDIARQQTLNNGGGLTNGLDVSKNLADKKAVENRGESNYINNDSKSLSKIEQNSEKSIEFKTEKDNMYYNKFGGDLKTIASVSGSIDSDELIGKTDAGLKLTSEQVQDASTQKFTESTITASKTKEQIGQEDDYYNNANNIYGEKARLDVNTDKGTVEASRQQNDAEQLKAAEMKQIDTVSKQNAEFNAKEKFGGAKAVSDEINKAEKEIETSEKVTISKNTKDYVAAGTGSGIEKSADYNAKADAVNSKELTQERADNVAAIKLTEGLTKPEVLQKQAERAGMSVEQYLRTQDQKSEYIDKDGADIKLSFDEKGNLVGRERSIHTKDGVLKEDQILGANGEYETVRSNLDRSKKIDASIQEDYSKIFRNNNIREEKVLEDYSLMQNFSSQTDFTTGNKNANNYAAAMALQGVPKEYREAVLNNMREGDTILESVNKLPGLNMLVPTIQSFMADVQTKKAINDIDGVKDTVDAYMHATESMLKKVGDPAKSLAKENMAIKTETADKLLK